MFWVNPYSQRNQRARLWLASDRNMTKLSAGARARSSFEFEHKAFERDLAGMRRDLSALKVELALRRLDRKYEGQPRDDAGRYGFGRRDGDAPKDPGLVTKPAYLVGPAARVGSIAFQKGIEATLALFAAMSAKNTPDTIAALTINARVFEREFVPDGPWVASDLLTKDKTDELCPKRATVQKFFDEAALRHPRSNYETASTRGTLIHKEVAHRINNLDDPDFRAEVSLIKSKLASYGQKGSTRLDVYENTRKDGTVCIHDGKTGDASFSFAEMKRQLFNAYAYYPGTKRVVFTEVRPSE